MRTWRFVGVVLWLVAVVGAVASPVRPLRFWAVTGSVRDVDMYRDLAREFQRKTGIEVEVTPLAWGNFATKYFAAMAAGQPPDIGSTNLGGPFDYGSVGGLVDLRREFGSRAEEVISRYPAKMLPQYTVNGRLFGLPSNLSTLVVCYRKDIFAQLGLQPPRTWSELNRVIGTLEANRYRYYFGWVAGAQWAAVLYTMPYGLPGIRMNAAGKPDVDWQRSEYQKGILQAMRLWHLHDSPGKDLGSRAVGVFRSNKPGVAVPLVIDLHWTYTQILRNAPEMRDKIGVVPWPKADDGQPYNVLGGNAFVIFRRSSMKEQAFRWLDYLSTVEVQQKMVLDNLDRGDESALMISPLKGMWGEAGRAFWQREEFANLQDLLKTLERIVPTFETAAPLPGAAEAGRMEANLLDQMATSIRDDLDRLARKHDLSRAELIRQFGKGQLDKERAALEATIASELKRGYDRIAPEARKSLVEAASLYGQHYGTLIPQLPDLERRSDAMTVVKNLVLGLMALAVVLVATLRKLRKHWVSYLFVAAPVGLALFFVFVPAGVALYLSFTQYHPVLPLSTARWVGAENYAEALGSGDVTASILRTLKYAVVTVPVGLAIALVLAYLLNTPLRGERYWRFLYFSPLVTSVVSIALIFSQLFLGSKEGWLNSALLGMGLIKDPIPFLTSEHTFLNCVILLAIWHGLAFTILVLLAGLQQIPVQLYEAAALDGAGAARRFWNVAVPGLRPQIFFITVLGVIGAFQVFETVYTLAGKSGDANARFGPNDSGLTMVPLIYHTGFETFEMGRSAAVAYILFALILFLTVIQLKAYQRRAV